MEVERVLTVGYSRDIVTQRRKPAAGGSDDTIQKLEQGRLACP
jgi:hypothetical protein